jgi:hypothetical protein
MSRIPRRTELWAGREVKPGLPIRRVRDGVVSPLGDFCCSSVDVSWSSEEMTMYCEGFLEGVMSLTVPENGSGWREQTSLASTAADRSKAQNSWAPKSREPCRILA